jgi:hypothetical protein
VTVGIGVVIGEGVVFATDSRSSFTPPGKIARVLSDNTHKVFQVANNALCTYGAAFVNGKNVAGHMAEFAADHQGQDVGPHKCAELLAGFLGAKVDDDLRQLTDPLSPDAVVLGFLVGGYGEDGAELWEVTFPQGRLTQIPSPGCAWRGQTDVIRRLVKGVDGDLLLALAQQLGMEAQLDAIQPLFAGLEYRQVGECRLGCPPAPNTSTRFAALPCVALATAHPESPGCEK